jgi:hypothetical protein
MVAAEVALFAEILLLLFMPLGIYLLVLANINRREDPVIVSGSWDAVGLLLASSGILLGVIPLLLHIRFAKDSFAASLSMYEQLWADYMPAFIAYFVFLLLLGLGIVWMQHRKTILYNCDPDLVPDVLMHALAVLGIPAQRGFDAVQILPGPEGENSPNFPRALLRGVVRWSGFSMMRHVTLEWIGVPAPVREAIEKQLRQNRSQLRTEENPAAGWLMGLSGVIFGLLFLAAVVYALLLLFPPKRL